MTEDRRTGQAWEATQAHIELLVRKRNALQVAAVAAVDQLVAVIDRSDVSPREAVALWEASRTWGVTYAGQRVAEAAGFSVSQLLRLSKDMDVDSDPLKGGFPIGCQLTPRKGTECVYLLMDGREVVYVGLSGNVRSRLKTHWRSRGPAITSWEVIPCADRPSAAALEADLIFQHKPKWNVNGVDRRVWTS